ncbi:MAG TPA: tetratricopeptide repeat protein [Vicinamibacterales bacterium]|nr:tetratricopeptide repeat protein [Vicinamibacterales bacterium]
MKSTERHQLKEDKFLKTLHEAWISLERNRSRILLAIAAVVLVLAGIGGYAWWRQQQDAKASAMLADALIVLETPSPGDDPVTETGETGPRVSERARLEAALTKFMAAAEAYPKSQPGLAARYHAAAALVELGRYDEAAQRYQEVIDLDGKGVYGRVARLGLAEVNVRRGQYEPAINAFKELSLDTSGDLPVDGILMRLARTYQAAGRMPEAVQSFKRIAEEFPQSPYAADARRELETIEPGA